MNTKLAVKLTSRVHVCENINSGIHVVLSVLSENNTRIWEINEWNIMQMAASLVGAAFLARVERWYCGNTRHIRERIFVIVTFLYKSPVQAILHRKLRYSFCILSRSDRILVVFSCLQ